MARKYKEVWPPYNERTHEYWFLYVAWCSPLNRGILDRERITEQWTQDYPHLPEFPYFHHYYRRMRHVNERRQYYAAIVDDDAPYIRHPTIRGKRRPPSLPDPYWDIPLHKSMHRSWKKKKVRKQWMVNL